MAGERTIEADCVVVGAGLSGLVAATELRRAGVEPVVLEARERVGGRLESREVGAAGTGSVIDVGGQWLGPGQDRMYLLARACGAELFPTHTVGDNLMEIDGRRVRYTGTIPRISPVVLADAQLALWRLDAMARRVPLDEPWRAQRATEWDAQTFRTWMNRNLRSGRARTLLEIAIEAVWAVEPQDLSLLHVLFYIRSAGGLGRLLETDGGAQQDRFVTGAQTIPKVLAEELGDRVVLGAPVRAISARGEGVEVRADGVRARARRVVVGIPPTLTARIAYDPPMPAQRDQLTQRMPQGTVIKCMAVYDRPFWRDEGLSGQALSDLGPVRLMFDNSPPDGSPGILLGFLEGKGARELGRVSEAERRDAVLTGFARTFGERAGRPDEWIDRAWAAEEFTRGCYGCGLTPGGWTGFGHALRPAIGPIHWAGSETATIWMGYMEGAAQAGERAGREVVAALTGSAPAPAA